ncbi:unnamed protein product [Heligmosomoides polygyrus]|uniref:POT1PC domain-containing protein n=1 Tax=Heligmosomoides polygyrus TaxID=6339 RepID=A0A183FAV1_HELPZ|nr:unnamed protein product [Heligmosomoides polygyrus]
MTELMDAPFRVEDEFEVLNEMNLLHVRFRCSGQPFPALDGKPSFSLEECRCSASIVAKELIPVLLFPASDHRVDCAIDPARILSIWASAGSISAEHKAILDSSVKVNLHAVAYEYAFFRHRCAHVALMSSCCTCKQQPVPLQYRRVALRRAEGYRDRVADVVEHRVENADQGRELCSGALRYCGPHLRNAASSTDLHLNRTDTFSDAVGRVVFVLPDNEPKDAYCWILSMHAVGLWLIRGTRIVFVNGPRSVDWNAWDRPNEKARESIAAIWI